MVCVCVYREGLCVFCRGVHTPLSRHFNSQLSAFGFLSRLNDCGDVINSIFTSLIVRTWNGSLPTSFFQTFPTKAVPENTSPQSFVMTCYLFTGAGPV